MRDRLTRARVIALATLITFGASVLVSGLVSGLVSCTVDREPQLARDAGTSNGEAGTGTGGSGAGGMTGGESGAAGTDSDGPCANGGGCSPLVDCMVEDGEAVCGECPEGTHDVSGDGSQCADIDECAMSTDDCDRDPAASCLNTTFSYECVCPPGFEDNATDGRNCEPMMSTGGSSGMTGGASGMTGGPVDECAEGTDDCDNNPDATCTDTEPGFTCTCPDGYEDLTSGGRNCVNIDECDEGTDECDDSPSAECDDEPGSYSCTCPTGYEDPTTDGRNCVQIDECDLGTDTCDSDPDACVDGLSSYTCVCPDGYTDTNNNGSVCTNINECTANTDVCDEDPVAVCADTIGSYTCTCPTGTIDVLGDGSRCGLPSDIVTTGHGHTCAIVRGGIVKCWGGSGYGESGRDSSSAYGLQPGQSGTSVEPTNLGGRAVQIEAGCGHTCALMENGDVKCWGANDEGQLGLGDRDSRGDGRRPCTFGSSASCTCSDPPTNIECTEPLPFGMSEMGDLLDPVPLGGPAIQVTAGCEYSCALLEGGDVKCWGGSEYGQVALGNMEMIGDEPGEVEDLDPIQLGGDVKKVDGGFRFVCAQFTDNRMKCWGRNANGQCGQNHRNHIGDAPGEIASLPFISLGTGRTAKDFASGYIHTCVLLDNNTVKCWGGAYGYGDYLVSRGDGVVQGNEADMAGTNEMGDVLDTLELDGTPVALAGQHHACALMADGSVQCWGLNFAGQLGQGDTEVRGDGRRTCISGSSASCTCSDPPAVVECTEPLPVGVSEMGTSLPAVPLGRDAIAVFTDINPESGRAHGCALLDDGAVKCWGDNSRGQLGIGDQESRGDDPGEMGNALPAAIHLW